MILSVTYYSDLINILELLFLNVRIYQFKSFMFYKVQTINLIFFSKNESYGKKLNHHAIPTEYINMYMHNKQYTCHIQVLLFLHDLT